MSRLLHSLSPSARHGGYGVYGPSDEPDAESYSRVGKVGCGIEKAQFLSVAERKFYTVKSAFASDVAPVLQTLKL
jgi:hypothetical protein